MNTLPFGLHLLFGFTTFVSAGLFYFAAHKSKTTGLVLLVWLSLQAVLGLSGFYTVTDSVPPRFIFTLLPPVFFILVLFFTPKGRRYIDGLDIKRLTILHIVRLPVELVIFWLCLHKVLPVLITFEGRNLDVISGLTAPIMYYFGFIKPRLNKIVLLLWNFICLGLLINVVTMAILSAPFSFQQFAFEQPAIAVLYFPFVWLPSCVVPLVLLSHLSSIRQLMRGIVMQYHSPRPAEGSI